VSHSVCIDRKTYRPNCICRIFTGRLTEFGPCVGTIKQLLNIMHLGVSNFVQGVEPLTPINTAVIIESVWNGWQCYSKSCRHITRNDVELYQRQLYATCSAAAATRNSTGSSNLPTRSTRPPRWTVTAATRRRWGRPRPCLMHISFIRADSWHTPINITSRSGLPFSPIPVRPLHWCVTLSRISYQ